MPRCRGEREQSQARSTIRAPRQRASPGVEGLNHHAQCRSVVRLFGVSPVHWTSPRKTSQKRAHRRSSVSREERLSFPSRNRFEADSIGRRKGIESAWQPRERALLRAMRALRQGPGLPPAVMTADHTFEQFPIARGPARLHRREAPTMARIPTRTAAGRRRQTATTSARSGGTALDFTLVLCSMTGFSPVKPGSFESCPALNHEPFPPEGNKCGESSRSGFRPWRGSPPEGSTSKTSGAPSNRLQSLRPSRL